MYFRPSTDSEISPSSQLQQKILYQAEQIYRPVVWVLRDDFDSYDAFILAVRGLDKTSSPGHPYTKQAPTTGIWLKWNGIEADYTRLQQLWIDVQMVMTGEYNSILRTFIKQEPHKIRKVQENRHRLIIASPLCVQVAWHMMFDAMNDLEIQECYNIPSQQGLVLTGGGWKQFTQQWKSKGLTAGLDISAWDWTAPRWALAMDLEFRKRMGRGHRLEEWHTISSRLYHQMFDNPTIITSGGQLFKQVVPGIMKSGCVNTISTNSHCQIFIHLAVCHHRGVSIHPVPVACGDDTLQHLAHTEDLTTYRKMGLQIKFVSETTEFVGHEFKPEPHPCYWLKHIFKLHYVEDEHLPTYLDAMARMYCHTDYYWFWNDVALDLGCPLQHSRTAYKYWYDYSD